jgi:hypothetical protein
MSTIKTIHNNAAIILGTVICMLGVIKCLAATHENSQCEPSVPGEPTANCGSECTGSCTRPDNDCNTCVGPASGNCTSPGNHYCVHWTDTCPCVSLLGCSCNTIYWTAGPFLGKPIKKGC